MASLTVEEVLALPFKSYQYQDVMFLTDVRGKEKYRLLERAFLICMETGAVYSYFGDATVVYDHPDVTEVSRCYDAIFMEECVENGEYVQQEYIYKLGENTICVAGRIYGAIPPEPFSVGSYWTGVEIGGEESYFMNPFTSFIGLSYMRLAGLT